MHPPRTTIYDFGMNNGDDVAYFLTRAQRVVAVEANPTMCAVAESRFRSEIDAGRLIILNIALAPQSSEEPLPFYVHKTNHVVSQLPKPPAEDIHLFEEVLVPQRTAVSVVREYGDPYYIKIDIEHCDQMILRDLLNAGILPDFISAECHTAEVLCLLGAMGYRAFNLVDGATVEHVYNFPAHSSGPFGYDLTTPWRDLDSFFYLLAWERLGWKDVHASRIIDSEVTELPTRMMGPLEHLRDFLPSLSRAIGRRLWR